MHYCAAIPEAFFQQLLDMLPGAVGHGLHVVENSGLDGLPPANSHVDHHRHQGQCGRQSHQNC